MYYVREFCCSLTQGDKLLAHKMLAARIPYDAAKQFLESVIDVRNTQQFICLIYDVRTKDTFTYKVNVVKSNIYMDQYWESGDV